MIVFGTTYNHRNSSCKAFQQLYVSQTLTMKFSEINESSDPSETSIPSVHCDNSGSSNNYIAFLAPFHLLVLCSFTHCICLFVSLLVYLLSLFVKRLAYRLGI